MSKTNETSHVVVRENINLTDEERQIFSRLLQVVDHFKLETQLRVAGGWVRDKLLGKECNDIDIALDNMMGSEFCEKVNAYLASTGEKTQGFGVRKSKPEKSKFLETANMHIFYVSIDFVNLTSKPMEFGSAEQDAYRRDLTINSLFYNIQTCLIEDFTGRGLDDLKNGKIVTPLPPKEMFLEDPLRVLRAVRFSVKFEFEMVKELKVAAADNDVKSAFCSDKISRERIGREIELMVSGNRPVKAIECICEIGLFWDVFRLPQNLEPPLLETCVGYMDAAWILMNANGGFTFSDEQRRLYLYAALFLPLRKTMRGDYKKQTISAVTHIFKHSLKLGRSDGEDVVKLHNAVDRFSSMIPFIVSSEYLKPVEVDWELDMVDVPNSLKLRFLLGIFSRLLQVVDHFKLETQLRVAGGWVRDKLLGKECNDIDIALDNMMGSEFCEKVNAYLASTGEKTQGFGVRKSKPEKSKFLETANMHIFYVSIDFVNLTSKPMEFGSAEQDAYRRDLTINSLFYNIQTCLIEDFTGRGLDDLKNGKIVTPLPPKEMFLEDPLRVLRAVRFSVKFEFEMVKELKVAAADNDVKSAFCSDKISRERIGREIELMVSGNRPVKAIECICEIGLFWDAFRLPQNLEPPLLETCVGYMDAAWILMNANGGFTFSDEQRRLYLYAALFLPLRKTMHGDYNKQTISAVTHIFKHSLKLGRRDGEDVVKLHNAVDRFSSMIPIIVSSEYLKPVEVDWELDMVDVPNSLKLRFLLGLLLNEIKDFWRPALLLSIMLMKDSTVESKIGVFKKVEEEILKLGLDKVWEVKPLINTRDIMKLLELKNGGPMVGEWQRKVTQWQLAYPSGNVEECIEWMMKQTQLKLLPNT
ncbi:O-methyltransferase, family 3 [Artemisia annua]|uniref:O-methyltransferase, family 3 n=1 Tax=Artemisia annua TaxID=35608 RepID=A0A2U1NM58_ARTAN|nr:O-methyltransferase, family 3 [Artemisia annua]